MIGPPDSLSNLRPIMRKRNINETELQCKLRLLQDKTQEWNQNFWAEHNTAFIKVLAMPKDKALIYFLFYFFFVGEK